MQKGNRGDLPQEDPGHLCIYHRRQEEDQAPSLPQLSEIRIHRRNQEEIILTRPRGLVAIAALS